MELKFHQALFGYDGGHQLLSSSLRLSTDAKHFLAVATDLSGSTPSTGFEQAYTGMPLPGTDYYVVFCTWLAPEMPRPGCVWSHVLLIEFADLAQIIDLGEVRRYFQRPDAIIDQDWSKPIEFISQRKNAEPIASEKALFCSGLLNALYNTPNDAVVVQTSNNSLYSELIFAMWSQQWPRLRRGFRFSTGSFSDRGRNGPTFDIQITPVNNLRAWQNSESILSLEDSKKNNELSFPECEDWLQLALKDLFSPGVEGFRSFLSAFGTDLNKPRDSFKYLARAHEVIFGEPERGWTEKLTSIGEFFPNEQDAVGLKQWMVGLDMIFNVENNFDRAFETIFFLCRPQQAQPFSRVTLRLEQIATKLWHLKQQDVLNSLSLLIRQEETQIASDFAAAISKLVTSTELVKLSKEHSQLLSVFISYNPELAFCSDIWRLPEHIQYQIDEILNKLRLSAKQWGQILTAKLISGTSVTVRETVENAGSNALNNAFHWLKDPVAERYLPSPMWRDALAGLAAARLRSPELLEPTLLAFCAWIISPETIRTILSTSRNDVRALGEQSLVELPMPLRLPTAFLLVTVGLRSDDLRGVKLIKRGYFEVYQALAATTDTYIAFSWDSWNLLSAELPQPKFWGSWDRCEMLRRGVRQWLLSHVKSYNPLLDETLTNEEILIARKTFDEL